MLYFDESGYTGPDLTNVSQPYFALASVKMTNDEIACLKKDIPGTERSVYVSVG